MVLAQNEKCYFCGELIGKKEKGCIYNAKGYVHYSCREKEKQKESLL